MKRERYESGRFEKASGIRRNLERNIVKAEYAVVFYVYLVMLMGGQVNTIERQMDEESEPHMRPGHQTELTVHRIKASDTEQNLVSNEEVREEVKKVGLQLSMETVGAFTVVQAGETTDIVVEPVGINDENGRACYTEEQVSRVVNDVTENLPEKDAVALITTNETDMCPEEKPASPRSLAWAPINGDWVFFSSPVVCESEECETHSGFNYQVALHELGHTMGLGHYGVYLCEWAEREQADPALTVWPSPISEVVNNPACGLKEQSIESSSGEVFSIVNEYESKISIMGSRGLDDVIWYGQGEEKPAFSLGQDRVFSTLDLNTLLPLEYDGSIREVSTDPATYSLGLEEGELNGISIALPEGHPLREAIAQAPDETGQPAERHVDRLVITLEAELAAQSRPGNEAQGLDPNSCDGRVCNVYVSVAGKESDTRYEFDGAFGAIEWPTASISGDSSKAWSYITYLDDYLGFGLAVHMYNRGDPTEQRYEVEVVDYQTGERYAQYQRNDYERYFPNEEEVGTIVETSN